MTGAQITQQVFVEEVCLYNATYEAAPINDVAIVAVHR